MASHLLLKVPKKNKILNVSQNKNGRPETSYTKLVADMYKILFLSQGQWTYGPTLCRSIDTHKHSSFIESSTFEYF